MTLLLVANPSARDGVAGALIPRVVASLERQGDQVQLIETERGEPISARLAEPLASADLVVVMGGDGSFAEVACALLDSEHPRTPLALLPAGMANNHGRSLGIPSVYEDLGQATAVVRSPGRLEMDVGRLSQPQGEPLRFFDSVGWGLQGGILHTRFGLRSQPLLGGELGYAVAGLMELGRGVGSPVKFSAQVRVDGLALQTAGLTDLVVSTSRWYGGRWILDRSSRPDDGLFELVTTVGWRELLLKGVRDLGSRRAPALPDGLSPNRRGADFVLEFDRPLRSQVDGEPGPTGARFEITVQAGALQVVVP